jgi:hypothetical protein
VWSQGCDRHAHVWVFLCQVGARASSEASLSGTSRLLCLEQGLAECAIHSLGRSPRRAIWGTIAAKSGEKTTMSDPPKEDSGLTAGNEKATGSGTMSRESVKEIVMEILRGLQDPRPRSLTGATPMARSQSPQVGTIW